MAVRSRRGSKLHEGPGQGQLKKSSANEKMRMILMSDIITHHNHSCINLKIGVLGSIYLVAEFLPSVVSQKSSRLVLFVSFF